MTAAIIPAAGKSRRMGTRKLLLPVEGEPLIVRVAREVLRAGVEPVIVVLSPEQPAVAEAVAPLRVTAVHNPELEGDMLSSVRCGLRMLPQECAQFFVVPGDQPGLTAELMSRLLAAQRTGGKSLVVPVCQGRRGHPVLIDAVHRHEILTCHDGTGLRGLFHAHPQDIAEVPVADPHALEDMDYPEDYTRLTGDHGFFPRA